MISKSQLKYIQSLGQKKHRDELGVFIAEGPKLVRELLQQKHVKVQQVLGLDGWMQDNDALLRGIDALVVSQAELERVSQLKTPNQVVAIVQQFDKEKEIAVKGRISLVLHTIQDPGNAGTIIRVADWFGVSQVICSHDCADVYNPKVVQSSMGSIARVKVLYTELSDFLKDQKDIRIYATVLEGKDVTKMNAIQEGLILIGNESKGLGEDILQFANEKITIPGKGEAESLNAAVATGIILSHLV